jgi:hypothetical protein
MAMGLARDPARQGEAEASIGEAMEMQEKFGLEPELARSRLSYARLLAAWDRAEEAERHRAQALASFRRLGMVEELARAEETPARLDG